MERANKAIGDMLKAVLLGSGDHNWLAQLQRAVWLLNDQPKASGWSANKLVFGRELVSMDEQVYAKCGAMDGDAWVESQREGLEKLRAQLEKSKRKMEEGYNRKHGELEIAPGDHVWVYREVGDEDRLTRKLLPRWRGPFAVVKAVNFPNVWELNVGGSLQQHHCNDLKLAGPEIPLGWVM